MNPEIKDIICDSELTNNGKVDLLTEAYRQKFIREGLYNKMKLSKLTPLDKIELIKQLCPEIVQYVELEFIMDTAKTNPYTRKEFLRLPIETRRKILTKQVEKYLISP
jgi:hypothetical protein